MPVKRTIVICPERCKACGLCVDVCKRRLLSISTKKLNGLGYHPVTISCVERCNGCGVCAVMCPDLALYLEEVI